jgi:hypothetical protein
MILGSRFLEYRSSKGKTLMEQNGLLAKGSSNVNGHFSRWKRSG